MWKVFPYRSVGPVEFGMTPEEVSTALGAPPDVVFDRGPRLTEARGRALFFYEDRPDGEKGCTAVRADDAGAFYVDGVGPLGAPWEEVRRAIEGLGGDWIAWEEGIASFLLGMIVTAPSSPLRTSAFAYRAPELEAQVMRGLCWELEMDPAAARSVGEAIDHGERGIAFETLYDAWERGSRGIDPLRCAVILRRIAEMLGFHEEAEALGAAMALSGASAAGGSLSLARFE
mgnify:CR=1 FL=1